MDKYSTRVLFRVIWSTKVFESRKDQSRVCTISSSLFCLVEAGLYPLKGCLCMKWRMHRRGFPAVASKRYVLPTTEAMSSCIKTVIRSLDYGNFTVLYFEVIMSGSL